MADREAARVLGRVAEDLVGNPRACLLRHFDALLGFCRSAAERRRPVVGWWD